MGRGNKKEVEMKVASAKMTAAGEMVKVESCKPLGMAYGHPELLSVP